MKSPVAAALGSVPGALAGVVLWTVAATCLLVAYYVGFEFLFLGLMCGTGKAGFGLCAPPSQSMQDAIREWVMPLTVFAFTFGEVIAALLGAVFGAAAGAALAKLISLPKRLMRRHKEPTEPNA